MFVFFLNHVILFCLRGGELELYTSFVAIVTADTLPWEKKAPSFLDFFLIFWG